VLLVHEAPDRWRDGRLKVKASLIFAFRVRRCAILRNERRRLRAVRLMAEMSGFIMSPSAMSVGIAETLDGASAI
jgi:hypothetical protein